MRLKIENQSDSSGLRMLGVIPHGYSPQESKSGNIESAPYFRTDRDQDLAEAYGETPTVLYCRLPFMSISANVDSSMNYRAGKNAILVCEGDGVSIKRLINPMSAEDKDSFMAIKDGIVIRDHGDDVLTPDGGQEKIERVRGETGIFCPGLQKSEVSGYPRCAKCKPHISVKLIVLDPEDLSRPVGGVMGYRMLRTPSIVNVLFLDAFFHNVVDRVAREMPGYDKYGVQGVPLIFNRVTRSAASQYPDKTGKIRRTRKDTSYIEAEINTAAWEGSAARVHSLLTARDQLQLSEGDHDEEAN